MKTSPPAEAMRSLRIKRKELGLCSRCGYPHTGTGLCLSCRQQIKRYRKPRIKSAFRKLTRWTVSNHSLYHYMTENNLSAKELAQMVGVSERTVLRWVFEKATPKEPVRSKVESLINKEVF